MIGNWLQRRASLTPDKVALIDSLHADRPISYAEWNADANRTAQLLHSLGVQKGDRVAILAQNCVEYLDIWFACGKLGAILQALNWRLTIHELSGILEDASPIMLIYAEDFLPLIHDLRQQASSVKTWLALTQTEHSHDHCLAEREQLPSTELPDARLSPDDPWVLCYTGGSTGLPKGAILTHANITWNAINTITGWDLRSDDSTLLNAPLFHTGGLNVLTAPLAYLGGTSIVCRSFDADQAYNWIERGLTIFFGVPTMFLLMQQHPRWETSDWSHLRLVISGGAPCPRPIFDRFMERGVDFKTGYGLTEAGPNTFWLPPAFVRQKPGAVGVPLLNIDLNIVDTQGQSCAAGEVGELLIRGPHVCAGYWNHPEETCKAIVDGWLHTGDLAHCDEQGHYWIDGRAKDVIISGGENIYPSEVENVLAGHPSVSEVALIALPDERWGEVGCACIVPNTQVPFDTQQLLDWARERLARYKVPRQVVIMESFPHTAANKVDKRALRDSMEHEE